MRCEICDKNTEELYETKVQGSLLTICKECSKFGEVVKVIKKEAPRVVVTETALKEEESLLPGYGSIIRVAREKTGLTQEAFGKKINESESLIKRLENENIRPTEQLREKLERALKITLSERIKEVLKGPGKTMPLTVGDIIKVKKAKK
jgi:putative transcription factor